MNSAGSEDGHGFIGTPRVLSSAGEHVVHTDGVSGSIPLAPTIFRHHLSPASDAPSLAHPSPQLAERRARHHVSRSICISNRVMRFSSAPISRQTRHVK